jgi:hypothetical protein
MFKFQISKQWFIRVTRLDFGILNFGIICSLVLGDWKFSVNLRFPERLPHA